MRLEAVGVLPAAHEGVEFVFEDVELLGGALVVDVGDALVLEFALAGVFGVNVPVAGWGLTSG